jgi:hypothetical protein
LTEITQYSPEHTSVDLARLTALPAAGIEVFDPVTLAFLNKISRLLLADKNFNRSPEIAALGYWLRKSNLETMAEENRPWLHSAMYSINPLGMVFHIAPSNVDTIFLYSLCISLLMGNSNVVRVSSAPLTATAGFIISCINKALAEEEFRHLKEYIKIITYSHQDSINEFLSAQANCRVIWGGNDTVEHFRNIPSSVYSKDLLFPNRISCSLIKASAFLASDAGGRQSAANDFFNDSYTFDQLGCSSPRFIFVLGSEEEKELFATEFYKSLSAVALKRYAGKATLLSVQKFNHLVNDVLAGRVDTARHSNNSAYFVETEDSSPDLESCYGGYFYLRRIEAGSFAQLKEMVTGKVQTLTWFGLNDKELADLNRALYGKRIDRIVPVGEALSFNYIWDGMNLFEELSRRRFISRNRIRL